MPYMTGSPITVPGTLPPMVPQVSTAQESTDVSRSQGGGMRITIDEEHAIRVRMRAQQEERAQRLKAKNRRKRYLEVHPEYFKDSSLELADPLLYDRLIRRFQTAAEREAEGQRRGGLAEQMTADLWRAEAKQEALRQPDPMSLFTYNRGPEGQIIEEEKDEIPMSKEEGMAWWVDEMTQRFLRGGDDDFDYKIVDTNDKYDDPEEERDIQDAYFDSMESDFDSDGEGKEKILTGETGIQDY